MSHMPITSCAHETIMSVYIPHMNALQWLVWPGPLVYIKSTLLVYANWTNKHVTLHMYVPLHSFCRLPVDPRFMNSPAKNQLNSSFIYHTTAKYVPATNMTLTCHIYTLHAQITQHASMWEVCQYICYIWSFSHQCCSQNRCTQTTTRTLQPKYIYWVGHLAKSVKKVDVRKGYDGLQLKTWFTHFNSHLEAQSFQCFWILLDTSSSGLNFVGHFIILTGQTLNMYQFKLNFQCMDWMCFLAFWGVFMIYTHAGDVG